MDLDHALIRLDRDLKALKLRWALVGGLAVSFLTDPRTTRDLDVAIAVSGDSEAERIALSLRMRGYTPHPSGDALEQTDVNRLATVRLMAPGENLAAIGVDLLFASSGIENEVVAAAQVYAVLPGLHIPVARIGHLLALKLLAGRPKDWVDARVLWQFANPEDVGLGRESLELIERRGFHRGKDLMSDFAKLLDMES
ncbi:MAG TPA: nucleotidyl transferase AbiEii/AbiGii toxin family protein [Thermoanaerobaculia bacterium]|nr:nucleotidyl transferase AbiEii/AbiGii toxin family protein [Thermoanaerobaculia bacterium]